MQNSCPIVIYLKKKKTMHNDFFLNKMDFILVVVQYTDLCHFFSISKIFKALVLSDHTFFYFNSHSKSFEKSSHETSNPAKQSLL